MAQRAFNVTAEVAGTLCSPPDALMAELSLPTYANGGRLYAYRYMWVQNNGDDSIELRTSLDGTPANAGEATTTVLRLAPTQRDRIAVPTLDIDDYIPTSRYYAFADAGSQDITIECE